MIGYGGICLLRVPCWDQVCAEPVRILLLSLDSAGNKVNSSSWAQKGRFHWHIVQNSILSQNLDAALWRTNGRCIYIKHETPSILCLWSMESFLPGFTGGLPSTSSNYQATTLPSIPTSPLLLFLSTPLQVYTSWLCTHRSIGAHKCSSSPLLTTMVARSGDQVKAIVLPYSKVLRASPLNISAIRGMKISCVCGGGGCFSVLSLGSRIKGGF